MAVAPEEPQLVRRPLVPAAAFFVLGVSMAGLRSPVIPLVMAVGLGAVVSLLAARRRVAAALLLPLVFLAAGVFVGRADRAPPDSLPAKLDRAPRVVEGRLLDPRLAEDGFSAELEISSVAAGPVPGAARPAWGRARVFVPQAKLPCGRAGDRVRVHARLSRYPRPDAPGRFDLPAWAARQGVSLSVVATGADESCVLVEPRKWGWPYVFSDLRAQMAAAVRTRVPGPARGVVLGLALGGTKGLPEASRRAIRDAGLSHLLAVSGFHVGVLAALSLGVWTWLFGRWPAACERWGASRLAALLTVPVTMGYPVLVGSPPSAVRAGVMLTAVVFGRWVLRGGDAWSALAAALLAMVAWSPDSLGDPGFQLSFVAVASLLRIPPALERALGWSPATWWGPLRYGWTVGASTLAATLGTAPLVAIHFGRLSVVGLFANFPASLIAVVAVPVSIAGASLGAAVPEGSGWLLDIAGGLASMLLDLAEGAASLPGAAWSVPVPSAFELVAFALAMAAWTTPGASRRVRRFGWLCALVIPLAMGWGWGERAFSESTTVTFLPVGQGDGAVVELPGGRTVLIDLGPRGRRQDAAERVIVPFLRHRGIRSVDLLVLTHPHADHIGGWAGLRRAMTVRQVWWGADHREGPEDLLKAVGEAEPDVPGIGTRFEAGAAHLEVLGPIRTATSYAHVNDGSLVVMLRHGARRVLFMGDAEVESEAELVERYGAGLRADLLKVGHHGSRSSSTQVFLREVRPEHAVISLGRDNGFGFPHAGAWTRLESTGAQLWRTDQVGAIRAHTDGKAPWKVEGYLEAGSRTQ